MTQNNDCKVVINANHDSLLNKEIYFLIPAEIGRKKFNILEKQVLAVLDCDE